MTPWTDLPQILIRELGRTTVMFLVWFKFLSLVGRLNREKSVQTFGVEKEIEKIQG